MLDDFQRFFSTHPMTEDRIKAAQENIQQNLKARPEYVLDTSEFEDNKARLATPRLTRNQREVGIVLVTKPRYDAGALTPITQMRPHFLSANKLTEKLPKTIRRRWMSINAD